MIKVLILNSGLGKRMGKLTEDRPKCMVTVKDGLSTLDYQMKIIEKKGISEVIMTTGPFEDKMIEHIKTNYPSLNVRYVNNPDYKETNYIYSIALAAEFLDSDIVSMHGDLLFEESVFDDVLESSKSVMVTDSSLPLPEKDFKAVVADKRIIKIGIDYFDNAVSAQPLYKLLKNDWKIWLDEIMKFCSNGEKSVYAENAFNEISDQLQLETLDIQGRLCCEIDTGEDLQKIREII
ncbi:MAG: NTP transferase domain-containing protein [Spirochaetes bacterium]|nr:NTP transferase domain-containing protein [Spirochaetota bacterium]MBN2770625.1 NTP transferase domain-containing protein [Spirochaetota bacterium]